MKVKILSMKCERKEGVSAKTGKPYSMDAINLFVSCDDMSLYPKVVKKFKDKGCTTEQIEKFSTPKEYNGEMSFAFWLKCSKFTFDHVQRFGILDAKISFDVKENGYLEAKIFVENGKEQVNGYEPSEQVVTGWNIPVSETQPAPAQAIVSDDPFYAKQPEQPIPLAIDNGENPEDDLPF